MSIPRDRFLVAAFGGSLGATTINRAVFELADRWAQRNDVAIRHAVGKRDWHDASLKRPNAEAGLLIYQAIEFEDRMGDVLTAADIVICRAGATTIAELAVTAMPSVLVPFPKATGDHQSANARMLADADAAIAVPDGECDGARLSDVISPLVVDRRRLQSMGDAARRFAAPNAASDVAALIEKHVGK